MPKPAPEKADELSHLDPDLRPDEESYVSHYLGYADILLKEPATDSEDHSYIIELPTLQEAEQSESEDDESDNAA